MNGKSARRVRKKYNKFLVSLAIDLVGLSDYFVPGATQVCMLLLSPPFTSWCEMCFKSARLMVGTCCADSGHRLGTPFRLPFSMSASLHGYGHLKLGLSGWRRLCSSDSPAVVPQQVLNNNKFHRGGIAFY